MKDFNDILKFWFPTVDNIFLKFWFNNSQDEYIINNFKGSLNYLENKITIIFDNEDDLLAKIIVLDQFSRNIYRGTQNIYKNDSKALELAKLYFKNNYYVNQPLNKIIFALMPFRHSENITHQKFVLDFIESYECDKESNLFLKFYNASKKSFDTINKYGYFPSRNKLKLV